MRSERRFLFIHLQCWLRVAVFAALTGCWSWPAVSATPLEVSRTLPGVPIGSHIAVGSDVEGTWTVETVRREPGRLAPWARDDLNLGITGATTWIRLQVSNASAQAVDWYLNMGDGLIDEVTLFEEQPDGTLRSRTTGLSYPWASRDVPLSQIVFALREPPSSERTLYLRVVSGLGKRLLMRAYTPDLLPRAAQLQSLVVGGLMGIFFGVGVYHFVLFLLLRDAAFFWHAAVMASVLASRAGLHSFGLETLWPQGFVGYGSLNLVVTSLVFVCALMFALQVLPLKSLSRWWFLILSCLRWCWVGLLVWSALWPGAAASMALTLLGLPTQLVVLLAAVVSWRTGSTAARWFLPAWSVLVLGGLVWSGRNFGWVPLNDWTLVAGSIGLALHALLLSVALALRVREAQRAGFLAQVQLAEERRLANEQLEHKVSERTRELRAARDQAEEASKAKDLVVRLVSHDLRTPLASIVAASERLTLAPSTATGIRQTAKGLIRLIDRLLNLDYLRRGALTPSRAWFPAHALVRRQWEHLEELANSKQIQLCNEVPPETFWLVDPVLMGEVVANLLSNAVKACPQGGHIRVACPRVGAGLVVEDDGPGFGAMPPSHQGSGLGLHHCREIMKVHGGQLVVDQLAKGARVTIQWEMPGPRVALIGGQTDFAAQLEQVFKRVWPDCEVRLVNEAQCNVPGLLREMPELLVWQASQDGGLGPERLHELRRSATLTEIPVLVLMLPGSEAEDAQQTRAFVGAGANACLADSTDPDLLLRTAVSLLEVNLDD